MLSNEELYMAQKIARVGVGTNNLNSFHYLGRGDGYINNTKSNIPVSEIQGTQVVYLLGDSLPAASPFTWYLVNQAKKEQNVKIVWVTETGTGEINEVFDKKTVVSSIYSFLKLINRNLIESGRTDKMFTDDICLDYIPYKEGILSEDSNVHLQKAAINNYEIETFITDLLSSGKEIFIFTEQELSGNACREVHHLAMLTGKMGRIADGIIAIKQCANSQGLIDMGINPEYGMGGVSLEDKDFLLKTQTNWGIETPPAKGITDPEAILNTRPKNIFIFGEDPVGDGQVTKKQMTSYFSKAELTVVQDFYLSPTAELAELVMPATYLFESGGTYTNTQKIIQQVNKQVDSEVEMTGFEQLAATAKRLGLPEMKAPIDAMLESVLMFPAACFNKRPRFIYSKD
jgi:predicted molibdopterin-dependent oxidoreductase YjgC